MTVRELIAHLQTFPQEMGVVYACYSDLSPLRAEEVAVTKAVPKAHYIMRVYDNQIPTMSKKNQDGILEFVAFPGN